MIPKQLQRFKFCRIKKGKKKPFEKDWTNKSYSYKEIKPFLPKENYGVLCGYENLAVIDADNEDLQVAIENMLPETYRVKTGRGGTHNYFIIRDLDQKLILETEDGTHLGEVQWKGQQVVGPNSIHPNRNKYEEINQKPITEIPAKLIYEKFKPFIKQIKEAEENKEWEIKEHSEIDDLSVASIFGTSGLKAHGSEYYGSHPIHGSEGGMNFWINPSKNIWHCFRHNSGGGPLSAIAVKEGIIDCSDARKGVLRGDKAIQSIEKAREKYGLKEKEQIEDLKVVYDKDLQNLKAEKVEWLIEDILPKNTICFLGGKRGAFKSFVAIHLAYCLTNGKLCFNKYGTKPCKVLFIDEENNLSLIKERSEKVKKGLEINNSSNIAYLSLTGLKIDNPNWINKLERLIVKFKPDVIIVDSLRRVVKFKENEAEPTSELFTETLKPLTQKYGLSWILIAHLRKGISGRNISDEMDEIRGSSDLPALADIVLLLRRNRGSVDSVVLSQAKNRYKQEITPKIIKIDWEQDSLKMDCVGDAEDTIYADEICSKMIMNWMAENEITSFKTGEAIKSMKEEKQTKPTTERALKLLIEEGKLIKPQRGVYELNVSLDDFNKPSNHQNHQDVKEPLEANKPSFTSKYNKKGALMVQNSKNKPSKEPSLYMLDGSDGSDGNIDFTKTGIKEVLENG